MNNDFDFQELGFAKKDEIWYGQEGNYWSNISQKDNSEYSKYLKEEDAYSVMKRFFPQHEEVIFSPKRVGGIATLDISDEDVILDAGAMWGALSIPMARTGAKVFAMDQTEESLLFLNRRKNDEDLENLEVICADLNKQELQQNFFSKIVVNGVLEWVPYREDYQVNSEENKTRKSKGVNLESPYNMQKNFLKKMQKSLKKDGQLYLAIENRYDFLYFLGLPEPHCNIRFISFMPRFIQNIIHSIINGSEFRTWTYSRTELIRLIESAGFSDIKMHYGFPDYRTPEIVLNDKNFKEFYRENSPLGKKSLIKKIAIKSVELIVYKFLKLTYFSPSFIVHATKNADE
jgi:cyclopropane fatty-acyl-phospholipid synthase-like methyltransferase